MRALVVALIVAVACAPQRGPDGPPPPDTGCRANEVPCVDGNLAWTGYCCPEGDACSGPFPNVGCGEKIGDACCPTKGGGVEARPRVRQRRAR